MEVCSKGRRRREMIRKRKPCLIKKANQLHTLCNVGVVLLIRLDHEILFYSSDTNINYPATIAVSPADPSSVKRPLIISIQALHWEVSTKMNILKPDNLVKQQKGITVAENYNLDIPHNRTHSPLARPSGGSSICHRCSSPVSTDERSPQEPNAIVGPAMTGDKEGSTRVLPTQGEEEGATIRTDQLNCLRKRGKACLKSPSDLKSTLRVTRSSAGELRRQTRSLTRLKTQRGAK